ncbi:MAG: MFS transporter [Candidatus Thorarchaeota archaeon]
MTEEPPTSRTLGHYFVILGGHAFCFFASLTVHFLVILWITVETSSVFYLTLVMFCTFLPQVIVTLFAGVFSDILNRRFILIASNILQLLTTVVLILLLSLGMSVFGIILFILIFRSILQAFYQPTFFAIFPSMVSQKHIGRINGFIYFLVYLLQIIAPLCASRIMEYFQFNQILWIEVIAIGNALIPLLLLKIPKVNEKKQISGDRLEDHIIVSYFKRFAEGFKTFVSSPGIIILFTAIFVLEFISGIFLPSRVYIIVMVHNGSVFISSLVFTFTFLGVFIGSNIFVIRKYWNPVVLFFFISILLVFLGDLLLILAPYQSFGLIFFTQIVKGFSLAFVYSMIPTFIQTTIPKNKVGRVGSIYFALTSFAAFLGTSQLGTFLLIIPNIEILLLITSIFGFVSTIALYLFTRIIKLKNLNYMLLDKNDHN